MSNLLVVRDKVQRYAKDLFETVMIGNSGEIIVPYESTQVFIEVVEFSQEEEMVKFRKEFDLSDTALAIYAPVLLELKPSNELFKWIATEGQTFDYVHFRYVEIESGGVLEVRYALPGDSLDPGELKNALISVAVCADDKDDELQKIFGGKKFSDL